MPPSERCPACGEFVETGRGLVIDDRVLVHDRRCLERWMAERGRLPGAGTVLMYEDPSHGPLTPGR
jgi:hypothetical protein